MSKSPEDYFVEAMRVFTVSKEYDDEFTDEMKTLLRTLAVAFKDNECRLTTAARCTNFTGHTRRHLETCRADFLKRCGLEDSDGE